MKKLNTDVFIQRANVIHNYRYDYNKTKYVLSSRKIIITCPLHGEFEQIPNDHLRGFGCKKCGGVKISESKTNTREEFINKANIIHNSLYDYSKVEYINSNKKISVICKLHGEFFQTPNNHLQGQGCSKCKANDIGNRCRSTKEVFIEKANKVHNKKYDYSKVEYYRCSDKVTIICPLHGIFKQVANSHLHGKGCYKCNESTGEKAINAWLTSNKITFYTEYKFDDCMYKRCLKFDFYLPGHNVCIEYDGEQHYKSVEFFGGIKSLVKCKERDNIKNQYCKKNNIKLIRIPYWKIKNIDGILKSSISSMEIKNGAS